MRWRFPTRDAPFPPQRTTTTTGPEESPDAPQPADPPPRRRRRTSAKPPALARFPKHAKPGLSHPLLARTHRRDRRARRRRRKAPGGDGPRRVRRRAGRRPTAVLSKGRTRERGHDPAKPEPDPRPRGGTGQPLLPNRGNAAGEGGARRPPHGTQHERRTHATRAARPRSAGTAKTGKRGRDRSRRGTDGGRVGPGSPPPPSPVLPARLRVPTEVRAHPRGSWGEPGSRGTRACAHAAPSFPATGNTPQAPTRARHAVVTTRSLAPRGSSPDSERGGAGRIGRHRKRSGFPPQRRDVARGTRPKLRASGGQGVPGGRPQARPLIGSLEKALFLTEGGRNGPGPTSLRPRQRKSRGSDTHAHTAR